MRPPTAVLVLLPLLPLLSHHTRLLAKILSLLLIAFIVATTSPLSAQTTFTVTNTNDGGTGSLRQALVDINSSCFDSAGCYIAFNLGAVPPAGYHTIALASPLPNVYKMNTHVDGTTQPGWAGIPVVVIDGSGAGPGADGLTVNAFSTGDGMGIVVSGLGIRNFSGAGIRTRTSFTPPSVTITGNYIGISPDGTPAPNGAGIAIDNANWSTIGGTTSPNRIAYNTGDAITIASNASGISIGPNSIYANGFGIDLLGTDGPTANDPLDADTGGNTLTNFPLVTSLSFDGTTTTVSGTLAGASSAMYDIDLYENVSADPSGYGQGETWVGEALGVTTNVSGNATFSIPLSGDHTAMHFTATATWNEGSVGPWHTSEFSPAFAAADLSITKTDGVTSLPSGGITTYTIEARNFGPGAVTGATIDDTITSLFSAASWTCSATAGSSVIPATGSSSISATANLAADGVITCLLTATLDPLTTGSITNTATITAPVGATDPVPTNNSASDTNTINPLPAADLAITKDDGVTTVIAGAPVTYTIVVSNSGPNPVTGASISDTPPPELINVTWSCTASGGAVCLASAGTGSISTTGNIPVGGVLTYTLQATVNPSLMGGSLVNFAVVSVPPAVSDPNSTNDIATDADTINSSADLQITIADAPDPVSPSGTINYTITATNAGPSDATFVSITLTFDAALTGTSIGTLPSGWSCSGSAPIFICSASNFPVGTVAFTASATAPAAPGTYTTAASIIASMPPDPVTGNDSATAATTVTAEADLGISKIDGVTSLIAGNDTTYTIVVYNNGPDAVTGATITDTVPASLTNVSWTCTATTGSVCGAASGVGSIATTADIAYLGSVGYTLSATLDPAATGSVTNSASVSSTIIDPVPTNNTAADTDTVVASAIADLRICRTSGTIVVTGTSLTYTLVASNGGPSDVSGARLVDIVTIVPFGHEPTLVGKSGPRIAPRLAGATWTCTASPGSSCGAATGTGDVDVLLDLLAGGSATVLVTVPIAADASGLISLSTAVTPPADVTDTTPGNNAIRLSIPIRQKADLAIVKGHTGTPSAGDTVAYTIIASNLGPGTANGARVTDILPPELTVLSWTCTGNAGATCGTSSGAGDIDTLVDLPPGSQAIFSLSAVLSDTATGNVTNSASITSPYSTSDANLQNNYAADPLGVAPCLLAPQPLAPLEEVLTDVTDVPLAWSDVGATSYEVFVSVNGGAFVSAGTAPTPSLTIPVTSGEVRWFVVATVGACSVTGPIGAFTVESCLAPATPVPSLVGQVNSGEPYTFSWTTDDDTDVAFEYRESPLESFDGASWTSTNERSITRAFTNDGASPAAVWYQVRAWRSCPSGGLPSDDSIPVRVAILPANASSDSATVQEGDDNPVSQLMRLCLNAQQHVVACGTALQDAKGIVPFDTPVTIGTDRSWMTVTPSSTTVPPGGTLVTVTASPLGLPTGTNTGSVVVTQSNGQVSNVPFSLNIVSPVTPVAKTPPPADALIIPAVAHADGAVSSWQSDIRLTNASLQKVAYELAFTPSGADGALTSKKTTIELAAGETKAFDDIVRQWFGSGALSDGTNGVLDVRPASGPKSTDAGALLACSRTYNSTSDGTYGQWIPAVPFSRFVGRSTDTAPAALSMQQINQSSRYRTNLGLVEAAGFPAIVRVTIFDAHGASLESFDVNLGAMEHRQLNSVLASRNISLENGRIETRVVSGDGRITAYASVIDTMTNDPILVPGTETSLVKSSRFVMPGVADLDTANNRWRTDLRVFNPSDRPVTISLVFYEQNEPSNRREAQLTVEPGNVAIVDDTLESLFGLSNVGGAIHFLTSSEEPLIITGRTFDQQAAGTYGQFIPAVTPADAVGVDDRALEIQQLEQSDRYRTNVGIAEVTGNGVEVELTAIVPGTTVAPTLRLTLDPSEFTQLNGVLQQMGLGNAYNARLSVKVVGGGGRVSAYGSIIDQKTNDPTYVPGQ